MESVLEHRLRSFVWFLVVFINPMLYILFWKGVPQNVEIVPGWDVAAINGYYLLMVAAQATLISHIEEDVSYYDIQQGELDKYLVKPFSYYKIKMIEELPYRLLQGAFAAIAVIFLFSILKANIAIHLTLQSVLFGIVTAILAFFLSHVYKMSLGLLAFWFTDIKGVLDLLDAIRIVLAGVFMPLILYPDALRKVADVLPFAYSLYYPIVVFQGQTTFTESIRIIAMQCIWFAILYCIYRILWKKGMETFTGVGK